MITRLAPPTSLIEKDPSTVIVSNKRPVQVYSNRVLRLITRDDLKTVKLTAVGGAIPTALRVARFCTRNLADSAGWVITTESVTTPFTSQAINLDGDGFGALPTTQAPTESVINSVLITLTRKS